MPLESSTSSASKHLTWGGISSITDFSYNRTQMGPRVRFYHGGVFFFCAVQSDQPSWRKYDRCVRVTP